MKKYKIIKREELNKHRHIINKYNAYITLLEKMIQDGNCNEEKFQKYNDLIVHLMNKREEYISKILGISAIEMAYASSGNEKFFELGEVMNEIFEFFENNTSFSIDTIKQIIGQNLIDVSIVEKFPDNPTGQGYYNSAFGEMAIRADQINSDEIKFLIRHELTHVLGTQVVNGVEVSGYSKKYGDDSIALISSNKKDGIFSRLNSVFARFFSKKSKYMQFNEACVEMFAVKDVPLQNKSMYDIWYINKGLNTNLPEGSFYIFNSNFVREMMIASGVSESELFEGLFDYKSSEKVMKKMGGRTFKEIAYNMDKLYEELKGYNDVIEDIFDKYYEENMEGGVEKIFEYCTDEEIGKRDTARDQVEKRMSLIEKMIIDKVLVKRLKKLDGEERKRVLEEFCGFIVCERDYFEKVTGFESKMNVENDEQGWIDRYRVDICKVNDGENVDRGNVVGDGDRDDIG